MGCHVEWENAQIVKTTLVSPWSFSETDELIHNLYATAHNNRRPVGSLIHLVSPFAIPTDLIRNYQRLLSIKPVEVVVTVIVIEETPLVNVLFGIIERMGRRERHPIYKTNSLDEARAIIHEYLAAYDDQYAIDGV